MLSNKKRGKGVLGEVTIAQSLDEHWFTCRKWWVIAFASLFSPSLLHLLNYFYLIPQVLLLLLFLFSAQSNWVGEWASGCVMLSRWLGLTHHTDTTPITRWSALGSGLGCWRRCHLAGKNLATNDSTIGLVLEGQISSTLPQTFQVCRSHIFLLDYIKLSPYVLILQSFCVFWVHCSYSPHTVTEIPIQWHLSWCPYFPTVIPVQFFRIVLHLWNRFWLVTSFLLVKQSVSPHLCFDRSSLQW